MYSASTLWLPSIIEEKQGRDPTLKQRLRRACESLGPWSSSSVPILSLFTIAYLFNGHTGTGAAGALGFALKLYIDMSEEDSMGPWTVDLGIRTFLQFFDIH